MKNDMETGDPVWELLTKAKTVEPSPFFARNVLRELRRCEAESTGVFDRLRHGLRHGLRQFAGFLRYPRLLLATGTAGVVAALALTLFLSTNSNHTDSGKSIPALLVSLDDHSNAFDPAAEMAAVEYLGQLMAVADPGQLDDSSLADLFF
ncbi:MAG: hypothetical protein KA250_03095 [Verrucomicrobiales bacterium]|nr:hypothetical protein [Verrucomicrobiales bacterium]